MDNMDRLLFAAADEANADVPYAHMKNTILQRAAARRARQNQIIRYGSMAAAFVVLLCAGVYFIGGSGMGRSDKGTPQSALHDNGAAMPNAYDWAAGETMPEAAPAPMVPSGCVEDYADDGYIGMNGVKSTSDDYGAGGARDLLLTEYIGEPMLSSFTSAAFGDKLTGVILEEVCAYDECSVAAEIMVEFADAPQENLDVGWAAIYSFDEDTCVAVWRISNEQYVAVTLPCKYNPAQIMSFFRAMVG